MPRLSLFVWFFIYQIWTSVVSIWETLQGQVLQIFICIGKPRTELVSLSGIPHTSMSFETNGAEILNYNIIHPFKNCLNMYFKDGILLKLCFLQSTGYIQCAIKILWRKNTCTKFCKTVKCLSYKKYQEYLSPLTWSTTC